MHTSGDAWDVDSGASKHITVKKEWFKMMEEQSNCDTVKFGYNKALEVKGIDSIPILFSNGNINDALYVHGLKKNLF